MELYTQGMKVQVTTQGLFYNNNLGSGNWPNYFSCVNDAVLVLDSWIFQSICLQS